MLNNKGQALIEFVLILPVFLFLIFAVYDFGMIFTKRNKLETSSNDIIEMYKKGNTVDSINSLYNPVEVSILDDTEYTKIVIKDKVKLITPGFNRIFGNPYKVEIERYIYNEQ